MIKITRYKATIRLGDRPNKIINWLTKNYQNEIGALGIGKVKDQEMQIERLVFPKQIVNGAHVHFKPEDWGPIIAELSEDEIKRIIFYWHKHPNGCPGASQGDEEDTFDVFMGEESQRKIFGFLQTAYEPSTGKIVSEARIEMRKPIWSSIEADIATDENDEIEDYCQQMIKEKITEGYASASDQPGSKSFNPVKKHVLNQRKVDIHLPIFEVSKKSGAVHVTISDYMKGYLDSKIELVETMISNRTEIEDLTTNQILYKLQPTRKNFTILYNAACEWRDSIMDEFDTPTNLETNIDNEAYLDQSFNEVNQALACSNRLHKNQNDYLAKVEEQFYFDRICG